MPKEVEDLVKVLIPKLRKAYPNKSESDIRSIAYAIANKRLDHYLK